MSLNETYRLHWSILCIHSKDGQRTAIMVPVGATVTTTEGPLDGRRMIDVNWNGKTVMMFTVDLAERGTLIAN